MARKTNRRKTRKAIAIIGEGASEKYYFNQVRIEENYNFKVKPELPKNSDYHYIFRKAVLLLKSDFDYVFCLIDLDVLQEKSKQGRYEKEKDKLLKEADEFRGKVKIIEQHPCFEIWFLLHYQVLGKTITSCDDMIRELKGNDLFKFYDKSTKWYKKHNVYLGLKSRLDDAISNCHKTNSNSSKAKCEIYKVIEQLREIQSS